MYSLFIYTFLVYLSLHNTSKALVIFRDEKRSYVSIWNSIQRFGSCQIYKRKRVSAFIIDETVIQIGNQHFWLWVCIEPIHGSVLGIYISEERNMLVAERFIRSLVAKYGKHVLCIEMVEHNITLKPVFFLKIPNILIIIVHVLTITINKIEIYDIYTIVLDYLYISII